MLFKTIKSDLFLKHRRFSLLRLVAGLSPLSVLHQVPENVGDVDVCQFRPVTLCKMKSKSFGPKTRTRHTPLPGTEGFLSLGVKEVILGP